MKKKSVKRADLKVPESLEEAAEFIGRIGEEQRKIYHIQNEFNESIRRLSAGFSEVTNKHKDAISDLIEGLFRFAEIHRKELTEHGKKRTVKLHTGAFGWRITPPAVSLRKIKVTLAEITRRNLNQFLRTKLEIDKAAMLRDQKLAKTIEGVSFSQYEEFVVKPSKTKLMFATKLKRLKRII